MDEGGREASTSGPWEEGRSCQNQRLESCASKDSTSLCCCNKQPPKLASLTVLLSCFHKTQRASGRLLGQLSTFHGTQWSRLYRSYGSYILTEALMSKGSEPWVAIQRGFDAFAWQQPFDQNKAYTLYSQGSWDIWENRAIFYGGAGKRSWTGDMQRVPGHHQCLFIESDLQRPSAQV